MSECHEKNGVFKRKSIMEGVVYWQADILAARREDRAQCWHLAAFDAIQEKVGSRDFPCLFAQKAWKDRTCQFLFCRPESRAEAYSDFTAGLLQYTDTVAGARSEQMNLRPLIALFGNSDPHHARHDIAWEALQWAHERDPSPWPENIETDPADPNWCYCFNGVELFINISSPLHNILKTRNLGKYLALVINPRKNFDIVADVNSRSGRLIREKIRSRIADFNDGVVPHELGAFGVDGSLEWVQYQLNEKELIKPSSCPLHIKPHDKEAITCS